MATARNSEQVNFGLIATGPWPTATHASIWIGSLYSGATPLSSPISGIVTGDIVAMDARALTVTLPAGEMSESFARSLLEDGLTGVSVRLHSGPPGPDGTANQIAGNGYGHGGVDAWAVT